MTNGQNFFNHAVKKNNIITYNNILESRTGQEDDNTTGCLLFCPYLNEHYKMMTIDLSKQQTHNADPKAIQQINFTANLD